MAGDDGFEKFVHASLTRLTLHVVKLGASVDEAKDAVSEALADAWHHWETISSPDRWVRLAAARAYFRSAHRDREQLSRALQGGMTVDRAPDGLEDVCGEEAATVLRLIQQLPRQQRHIMALTYDGYAASEIAQMLQLPRDTVRSHLRHARRQLREQLKIAGMWDDEDDA